MVPSANFKIFSRLSSSCCQVFKMFDVAFSTSISSRLPSILFVTDTTPVGVPDEGTLVFSHVSSKGTSSSPGMGILSYQDH